MSRPSRLGRNILFNFVCQGVVLVLSFVAVRFIFRRLGTDALGIIYFIQAFYVLAGAVLELGVAATTVREVAARHESEPEYARRLVRTASTISWLVTGLMAAALWLAAPTLVGRWINLTSMTEGEAVRVLRILGTASLLVTPQALGRALLEGLERMDVSNLVEAAGQAARQLGAVAILLAGGGLFDVVWWLAASYVLIVAAYAVACGKLLSPSALVPGFAADVIRRNLRYALGAACITLFAAVHMQADKVIVSKLLPLGELGFYGFASAVAWRGLLLARAVGAAAFPSFSGLWSRGDRSALMDQYWTLQDLVCWGLAPFLALFAFGARPLFALVFSSEVARAMQLPVALLCVGIYMNGTLDLPHRLAMASGRPQIMARLNVLALFVVLPATAALIYSLGLIGAALSWILYHLFAYAYAVPRVCRECGDFAARAWYAHVAKVFAAVALTYGSAWSVLRVLDVDSVPVLAAAYLGSTIVYSAAAWKMARAELRRSIRRHLRLGPRGGAA